MAAALTCADDARTTSPAASATQVTMPAQCTMVAMPAYRGTCSAVQTTCSVNGNDATILPRYPPVVREGITAQLDTRRPIVLLRRAMTHNARLHPRQMTLRLVIGWATSSSKPADAVARTARVPSAPGARHSRNARLQRQERHGSRAPAISHMLRSVRPHAARGHAMRSAVAEHVTPLMTIRARHSADAPRRSRSSRRSVRRCRPK